MLTTLIYLSFFCKQITKCKANPHTRITDASSSDGLWITDNILNWPDGFLVQYLIHTLATDAKIAGLSVASPIVLQPLTNYNQISSTVLQPARTLCESFSCHATRKRVYLSFPLKLILYKLIKLLFKWFIMLDKAGESRKYNLSHLR